MTALQIWTVYDHPTDYPDNFVARRFDVDGDGVRPTSNIIIAPDLDTLRNVLQFQMGLSCITRYADDDPNIVEVWL